MLAAHLPAGAQTWVSCGHDNAWDLTSHLTASVFDALNVANWQRGGDPRAAKPKPVQRPGDARVAEARAGRVAERARRFRERQAAQPPPPPSRVRDARGRFAKEA